MSATSHLRPVEAAGVDIPELLFRSGLPGFPGERRFGLVRWGGDGPYSLMVDLDDPGVRFLVTPPSLFFPDYVVDLDDATAAKLSLERAEDCLLLVIVNVGERVEDATANLLGPLVINLRTQEGLQAVLAESGYPTRAPLCQTDAA